MILQRQLIFIRERWHPLWRLRKWPFYRYMQEKLDFTSYINVPEVNDKIAVRFLRDFNWVINSKNFEPEIRDTFKLVLAVLKPNVFWDIGANIGFYSWFVKQTSSINELVLFEPDPVNFSLLQKTIEKNKINNCKVWKVAVSDQIGQLNFIIDQASGATGSLAATSHVHNEKALHHHYGMGKSITCEAVTVDVMLTKAPAPDLIKIDVEGAEHLVIAGATTCLKRYKPTLIIETTNTILINKIQALGYTVYPIDAGNYLFVSTHLITLNDTLNDTLQAHKSVEQ